MDGVAHDWMAMLAGLYVPTGWWHEVRSHGDDEGKVSHGSRVRGTKCRGGVHAETIRAGNGIHVGR